MLAQTDYSDIHQTDDFRENVRKCQNLIALSMYTDGGRYSKTGGFEGWPIVAFFLDLPPILRDKYSNIIFMGFWYSKTKPNWNFVFDRIGSISQFNFDGKNYRIKFLQVIADIPAKQSLLSMINVQGYDCCLNCNIHGEHVPQHGVVFPHTVIEPRNVDTFLDKVAGVNDTSRLFLLIDKFPQGFVIDPMHSVYRGPIQDDVKKLLSGFKLNANERLLIKFDKEDQQQLDILVSK
uniref:Uncharacterized protein n=1 Tax=Panagrolaimus superbus TaxID=310955 RepID=A0A914YN53_9BILA